MEMKDYLISFVLVALFAIAIISFGTNMGIERGADVNLINNTNINTIYSGVNSTLYDSNGGTLQANANDTLSGFNQEDVTGSASDGIFFSVITSVGKAIMGVSFGIFKIVWDPLLKILIPNSPEIRAIVGGALSTILLLLMALLAWKLYRTGS